LFKHLAECDENHYHLCMTAERKVPRQTVREAPHLERSRLPTRITSRALLGGERELIIEHGGRDYRLRLTQQGKLILTA
jgi:hemin uptake protein HemP